MTRLVSAISILFLTIIGCESKNNVPDSIPDGVYTGTFQRQQAFGGGEVANVTITFFSNT
jgi:major membrane immunogen (membrane-anchored lipoprotein)